MSGMDMYIDLGDKVRITDNEDNVIKKPHLGMIRRTIP